MERRTIEYMDEEFVGYTIDEYGGIVNRHGRVLRPHVGREGYSIVALPSKKRGKSISILVHRLVCWTFNGPPPSPEDFLVRHLDGVRHHNHRDNLRWGTPQDNADDRRFHRSIGQHHVHVDDAERVPRIGVAIDPLKIPGVSGLRLLKEERQFLRDLCGGLILRGVPARIDVCGSGVGVWFIVGMEVTGCYIFEKFKDRSKRHRFLRVDAGHVDRPDSVTAWSELHRFLWDDDLPDPCQTFRHFELTALDTEIAKMGDWFASLICARAGLGELDPSHHRWTHDGLSGRYTWTTTGNQELVRCTPKDKKKDVICGWSHESVVHRKTSKNSELDGEWKSYMSRNAWKPTRIRESLQGPREKMPWYRPAPCGSVW